jgi:hypothetical protein
MVVAVVACLVFKQGQYNDLFSLYFNFQKQNEIDK